MTDLTGFVPPSTVGNETARTERHFALDETYWGYIVRPTIRQGTASALAQAVAMLLGAAMIVAAIGLWLVPGLMLAGTDLLFRAAATMICLGAATLMLWFASRGAHVELQVDTHLGELRQVIRNRAGRSTLVGRHGFDVVGDVTLADGDKAADAMLLLRHHDGRKSILVAEGSETSLIALHDRLRRDLLVSSVTN